MAAKCYQHEIARLMTFPNVLITAHQAFFTKEALEQIASTTLQNLEEIEAVHTVANEVRYSEIR
jgi:D-lactate dehydrogenase